MTTTKQQTELWSVARTGIDGLTNTTRIVKTTEGLHVEQSVPAGWNMLASYPNGTDPLHIVREHTELHRLDAVVTDVRIDRSIDTHDAITALKPEGDLLDTELRSAVPGNMRDRFDEQREEWSEEANFDGLDCCFVTVNDTPGAVHTETQTVVRLDELGTPELTRVLVESSWYSDTMIVTAGSVTTGYIGDRLLSRLEYSDEQTYSQIWSTEPGTADIDIVEEVLAGTDDEAFYLVSHHPLPGLSQEERTAIWGNGHNPEIQVNTPTLTPADTALLIDRLGTRPAMQRIRHALEHPESTHGRLAYQTLRDLAAHAGPDLFDLKETLHIISYDTTTNGPILS